MRAYARCFRISGRLHHRRKISRCHWFHEAESGSLALGSRLRSRGLLATRPAGRRTDPFRAVGCPSAPGRSYMVNEQFTWLTPRSQLDKSGLTWRTGGSRVGSSGELLPLIEPDMQISSIRLTDTRRQQGPRKELTGGRHSEWSP